MTSTLRSAATAAFVALLTTAPTLSAQHAGTEMALTFASVPRFPIGPSPIGLISDVRPKEYPGVTGPRSSWLGDETGTGEIWVHPLKAVHSNQMVRSSSWLEAGSKVRLEIMSGCPRRSP